MAAIAHAVAKQSTAQNTTSGTYTDVTGGGLASDWSGATLSSGTGFTAGKKYWITATCKLYNTSANTTNFVQMVHGSTAFAESELIFSRANDASKHNSGVYQYQTVWTAVSSEGIKLQFKCGAGTIEVDQVVVTAMCLTDSLTENTDWFFAERSTDDALSTTATDGASITFTPGTAGHDWLVQSFAQFNDGDATNQMITRIDRSGEATSSLPLGSYSTTTASAQPVMMTSRVFNLGSASNTFKEQSLTSSGTAHVRLHSSIFALNLNKFDVHSNAYTAGSTSLTSTDYGTQAQTVSITPSTPSNVMVVAYMNMDPNGVGGLWLQYRIQVDNVDDPTGQTADLIGFNYSNSTANRNPSPMITVASALSAAAHSIDLDGGTSGATTLGRDMSIAAFTMELAATTPNGFSGIVGGGGFRNRWID